MITSRSNPTIKQIRALRQRKERQATGLFLVEGIKHVGEAVEASGKYATVESLLYSPELLTSTFALEMIRTQSERGVPCYALSGEVFRSVAEKDNPQGLLAVARWHPPQLEDLHPPCFSWGVALVQPQDPGNIGAILRTVDAVNADGVLLLDSGADPTHPNAVRASMGAMFWRPLINASFAEFIRWAEERRYNLIGTSAHGDTDYRSVSRYTRPLVLVMGSEREGLSMEQARACRRMIRLPMHGRVTSLNLAVAAGIMLYDICTKLDE